MKSIFLLPERQGIPGLSALPEVPVDPNASALQAVDIQRIVLAVHGDTRPGGERPNAHRNSRTYYHGSDHTYDMGPALASFPLAGDLLHRRRVVAGSGLLCLRQGRVHGRQGGPAGLAGFQVFLHRRPALL